MARASGCRCGDCHAARACGGGRRRGGGVRPRHGTGGGAGLAARGKTAKTSTSAPGRRVACGERSVRAGSSWTTGSTPPTRYQLRRHRGRRAALELGLAGDRRGAGLAARAERPKRSKSVRAGRGACGRRLGLGALPLDDGFDDTDTFRYGDVALDVPLPDVGVTTLAGVPGVQGYRDGEGSEALFERDGKAVRSRTGVR